ncbi:18738_t:CDS:2, partial [Acaulospora morrowiae]
MAIDILLEVRDTLNWVDRTDDRDFISQPNSPILESEKKSKKTPPPIQHDQSVITYFEAIKLYALESGLELDSKELKKTFFDGLLLENKKYIIRFGIKNTLNEFVDHLNNITIHSNDMQKFRFGIGIIEQGNASVMDYYIKFIRCTSSNNSSPKDSDQLKYLFLLGLSPDNLLEAKKCGLKLPLDELLERLDDLEIEENIPIEALIDIGADVNCISQKNILVDLHIGFNDGEKHKSTPGKFIVVGPDWPGPDLILGGSWFRESGATLDICDSKLLLGDNFAIPFKE